MILQSSLSGTVIFSLVTNAYDCLVLVRR